MTRPSQETAQPYDPAKMEAALNLLDATQLLPRVKGLPFAASRLTGEEIADQGWAVLADSFATPIAVLKDSALEQNLAAMAAYCRSHDAYLAPHGKTTMAPELWRRQFEHGAWALTVAVPHQVQAAREFGVNRILLANELVDGPAIAWVAQESEADSGFEFYCYVDSPEACRLMEKVVSEVAPSVVLNVVIEVGWSGGRTGCRTFEDVMELAEAISQCSHLTLVGLAGFEGAVGDNRSSATLKEVRSFLEFVARCYASLTDGHRFGETPRPILTLGGSELFDVVLDEVAPLRTRYPATRVVLRSGCYAVHDSGHYAEVTPSAQPQWTGRPFEAALELIATVVSRPESGLALLNIGRRDTSNDEGFPRVLSIHSQQSGQSPREVGGFEIFELNDQHAFVRIPEDGTIHVGDRVRVGVSHPCTTLDKWRAFLLVDDQYEILDLVWTVF